MREKLVLAISIILYFSIILTTASPVQKISLFDDQTGPFSTTNSIQHVYAADDESGGGDEGSDGSEDDPRSYRRAIRYPAQATDGHPGVRIADVFVEQIVLPIQI